MESCGVKHAVTDPRCVLNTYNEIWSGIIKRVALLLTFPLSDFLFFSLALRALEVLPLALPCPARELSEAEKQRMEDQEENTLRELRLFLRDVTKRLATDKRFNIFSKPVDIEEVLFQ